MSAFGGKADLFHSHAKSPLIAISGHCTQLVAGKVHLYGGNRNPGRCGADWLTVVLGGELGELYETGIFFTFDATPPVGKGPHLVLVYHSPDFLFSNFNGGNGY